MIKCSQCGAKNSDESDYCEECGASLGKETVHVYDDPVNAPLYRTDPSKLDADGNLIHEPLDWLCLLSFICSLVLLSFCGFASFLSLAVSIYALARVSNMKHVRGKGLAIAGIIISAVGMIGIAFIFLFAGNLKNA